MLSHRQRLTNVFLSWPRWLAASAYLAANGAWLWALPMSFMFFLCTLRQAHDSYQRQSVFFAVWSVHRGCDPDGVFACTERRRWVNCITVHLLYHVEYHLLARVPANHLPELARRLDAVAPEWTGQRVLVPARSAGRQWAKRLPGAKVPKH